LEQPRSRSISSTRAPYARPCWAQAQRDHPPSHGAGEREVGRSLDKAFAGTNELRTRGTDALLAAAPEAGARRFVAQSFANYPYAREGGMVETEDDPLDPTPARNTEQTNAAMRHLDHAVTDLGGIALLFGGFYADPDDLLVTEVRKRRYPIIGDGGGHTSWIHLEGPAESID
jgi:hypothetical protein